MGMLTEDMKRIVREQRLGYVATVSADGTPNLSPKGTTAVWDDDHLMFADIRSPQSVEVTLALFFQNRRHLEQIALRGIERLDFLLRLLD